ncbi:SDR family oxidoreductase [Salimicrobium sp. PL1-032A]|uniref:SDR family oxidoreductase n=1 Tax=Salimicrobium sp. PL1-032A TaxID=3095364 RepID=UPI003261D465
MFLIKVLVIGAAGQVGKHVVEKLKQTEAYTPVAMVRSKEQKEMFQEQGVSAVLGDLEKDFESAYADVDAVIFAAGSGADVGAEMTIIIDQEGAIKAIDRAKHFGVQRFIMLSSMAADRPEAGDRKIKHYLFAKHRADEYLKSSGLPYTIVRPGPLTNEEGRGTVFLSEHVNGGDSIAREDVAAVLVAALAHPKAEDKSFDVVQGDTPVEDLFRH